MNYRFGDNYYLLVHNIFFRVWNEINIVYFKTERKTQRVTTSRILVSVLRQYLQNTYFTINKNTNTLILTVTNFPQK
jgi:hypothetical protein